LILPLDSISSFLTFFFEKSLIFISSYVPIIVSAAGMLLVCSGLDRKLVLLGSRLYDSVIDSNVNAIETRKLGHILDQTKDALLQVRKFKRHIIFALFLVFGISAFFTFIGIIIYCLVKSKALLYFVPVLCNSIYIILMLVHLIKTYNIVNDNIHILIDNADLTKTY